MKISVFAVCVISCILLSLQGRSQGMLQFRTPGSDSMKVVVILNTDNFRFEQKDKDSVGHQILTGNVRLQQEKTFIYCDSLITNNVDNTIECFGHVHINDKDSINIYSDYMKYLVNNKMVYFQKNVKLTDGKGVLTSDELQYDLNTKIGVYSHGGKVVNNGSVLTSDEATYYGDTRDVLFKKNVILRDPQYNLSADSLKYNTDSQISTFITETLIVFKDTTHRTVLTREGYYDLHNKKASFGKRAVVTDGSQEITGDKLDFDDSTGVSIAIGNAIYKDTSQGVVIIADHMVSNKKKNTFLATETPVLVLKQDKDSIYVAADTFYSGRLIDAPWITRQVDHTDSLHHKYVDSLYKRQADSAHKALSDTVRDSTAITDYERAHPILVKDESHQQGQGAVGQTATAPPPPPHPVDDAHQSLPVHGLRKDPSIDSLKTAQDIAKLDAKLAKAAADTANTPSTPNTADTSGKPATVPKLVTATQPAGSDTSAVMLDTVVSKRTPAQVKQAKPTPPPAPGSAMAKAMAFRDSVAAVRARTKPAVDSSGQVKAAMAAAAAARPVITPRGRSREQEIDTATGPLAAADSNLRFIQGYHHVRIFSDSLQAVADSLYYSGKDSIFRLFKNPIAWGNGNYQVTGDTMFVYTRNKKASRLYVFENGLTINKVGPNFYNQIKGTTINVYFKNGEVDYMRAKGNAESIYYVQDDQKAYSGVNKAHADIIDMIFALKEDGKSRELNRVVLRNDAEGTMTPFKHVNHDEMRLRGFKWQDALRPKTKFDLFQKPAAKSTTITEKDL